MKKRTLLTALLVIPMGIATAQSEAKLGTQAVTVTTGGPEATSHNTYGVALGTHPRRVTTNDALAARSYLGTQPERVTTDGEVETEMYPHQGETTLGTQSGEITTGGRGTDVYTREGQERVRMQRANVR